jgi:hypothetical protein
MSDFFHGLKFQPMMALPSILKIEFSALRVNGPASAHTLTLLKWSGTTPLSPQIMATFLKVKMLPCPPPLSGQNFL